MIKKESVMSKKAVDELAKLLTISIWDGRGLEKFQTFFFVCFSSAIAKKRSETARLIDNLFTAEMP